MSQGRRGCYHWDRNFPFSPAEIDGTLLILPKDDSVGSAFKAPRVQCNAEWDFSKMYALVQQHSVMAHI